MREILASMVVLALAGCGTSSITVYKMVDGEPEPVVEIEQKFAGKGCVAVDSQGETASVIVQQAGTSDWSLSRAFGFLGDIVGGVFGGSRGMEEMQGPATGMQGCEGLFEAGEEEPDPPPDALYRLVPEQPDE